MALTVVHTPTKYNFSRNPHFIEVTSNNTTYTVDLGKRAETWVSNMRLAIVNDTLTLSIGGGAPIVLTFKAATTIASNEIAIKTGGQSASEYLAQLCIDLSTHTVLGATYDFYPYGVITFVAKAKLYGPAYTLTGSTIVSQGAVINYIVGTTIPTTEDRPNYKIGIELYAETQAGSNTFEKVLDILKDPSNNKITCDLAEVINANLEYDIPDFDPPLAPFRCVKSCKRFYIKLAEYYGDPISTQSTTQTGLTITGMDGNKFISAKYHVLKAGFDKISRRIMSEDQFNYYALDSAFLTRQQRVKKIAYNQIEWLYWLFNAAPITTAALRFRLYKADNSVFEVSTVPTTGGVTINDLWAFPVRMFDSAQAYIKMEACLVQTSGGGEISETFTYLLDESAYPDATILHFVNSDAGLDTLRLTGVNECRLDFEREVAERTITPSDTQDDGDMLTLFAEKNNSFTVFSGWKTQDELNYVEELLLTRHAFTYGNAYGQNVKVPVIITSKQLVRNKTNRNLRGYVIEYKDALVDEISQANYYPIV